MHDAMIQHRKIKNNSSSSSGALVMLRNHVEQLVAVLLIMLYKTYMQEATVGLAGKYICLVQQPAPKKACGTVGVVCTWYVLACA